MGGPHARRHGSAEGEQGPPEPTLAEKARTLVEVESTGTLATLSFRHGGWPFGSVAPYAADATGRPLILISAMAVHSQNLQADPRASLLACETDGDLEAQAKGRVTLLGRVERLGGAASDEARERYLSRHASARYWVDFSDFAFHRLSVEHVYHVGGFGVMGWIAAEDYAAAEPDPLAAAAPAILDHCNRDHADALVLLARALAGVDALEARMTSVDRLGFRLRLRTADGVQAERIAFPSEARSAHDCRGALVEMVRRARASGMRAAGEP